MLDFNFKFKIKTMDSKIILTFFKTPYFLKDIRFKYRFGSMVIEKCNSLEIRDKYHVFIPGDNDEQRFTTDRSYTFDNCEDVKAFYTKFITAMFQMTRIDKINSIMVDNTYTFKNNVLRVDKLVKHEDE